MRIKIGVAMAALASGLYAETVLAQDLPAASAASDPAGEETTIIVSGFRRLDTPLQDEAVASTSLDEDIFRYSGSTDRIDVLRTVPGVTVLNLGGRSTIIMRGMSTAPDGDPNGAAAASYIGDVALSGLSGSRENVDLSNYDIDRIDVLRGPQGYSYGGGAMSGVVRTVPNPADTSEFSARIAGAGRLLETGSSPGFEADGYVNIPLIPDMLAVRLTAYANREENPIYSSYYNRQGAPATVEGGRLSLRYEPTDTLTFDLRYIYEQRQLMDLSRTDPEQGAFITGERREGDHRATHLVWANADWELGIGTISYVGSYLTTGTDTMFPIYYAGSTIGGDDIDYLSSARAHSVTQELRIADADEDGFDWTLGIYYDNRRSASDAFYALAETETASDTEFDFDGVDDPDVDNFTGAQRSNREEQKSAFAEIAYWFDGEFGITLGTRLLDHTATSGYIDEIGGVPGDLTLIETFPGTRGWWQKLNLSWKPQNGHLYYAQIARVERPGGTNYGALDASCPAEYAERVQEYYQGDSMTTVEGGAKLAFGGGFRINASAYYSNWQNAPTYTGALCDNGINYYIDNAGTLEIYGFEMDAQMRIAQGLSASMSAAYGIAEITSVRPSFTGGVVGDRTPGNPDWKVSGSLDYETGLSDTLEFFTGAGFSYTGHYLNGLSVDWSTFAAFETFPGLDVGVVGQFPSGLDRYNDPGSGDYILFDARIGLSADQWKATMFVDNLFNSQARSLINYLNITNAGNATYTRVTPRTAGVRVEYSF